MSIRRTLLLSFLLMAVIPAVVLTGMAFFQARQALQREIGKNLEGKASALIEQIDRMLFERLGNVHTWSHLEIMKEVRVGDVDKKLSHFLFDLKDHYGGVYKSLFCTDQNGAVVASTEPSLLGKIRRPDPTWLTAVLPKGDTYLAPLAVAAPSDAATLSINAPIHDFFGSIGWGNLHADFDWTEILRLLDQSERSTGAPTPQSLALLFDAEGRIIAASAAARSRGLLLSHRLASWVNDNPRSGVRDDPANVLGVGRILEGSARSKGYQNFTGFGWSVVVVYPVTSAFAPINRMGLTFIVILAITSFGAIILSVLVAGRIARPIVQLTEFTRHFMERQQPVPLPPHFSVRTREVSELEDTFTRMIEALDKSKANMVRAAKLAVVGEMAAIMAHEVRTPLGILRSSAQMLQRETTLTLNGRELLSFILSETDRLGSLVSALLDCGSPRPPEFRPCHIHEVIERTLDLLGPQADRKSITLSGVLTASTDFVSCDEDQMMQVFLNLLMNPIQILPPGGAVVIRTRSDGSELCIQVDDDGPGIPEDHRERVFHPFVTAREGGVGLGLTVVQQIVQAHAGTIRAEASAAGGARFTLVFPALTDSDGPT